MDSLHGDFSQRVVVDTSTVAWQPSPSPTVWRKRLEHMGPPEEGRVTSLVRYDAGAAFPEHGHPKGEEILVLEGTFSDHRGDFSAGSYLLNPEGFVHAPFSEPGCVLLVKLRQYGGKDRPAIRLDTTVATYTPLANAVNALMLYACDERREQMRLIRMHANSRTPLEPIPRGREVYVIDGAVSDSEGTYSAGTWLRIPAGEEHQIKAVDASTIYVRDGLVTD